MKLSPKMTQQLEAYAADRGVSSEAATIKILRAVLAADERQTAKGKKRVMVWDRVRIVDGVVVSRHVSEASALRDRDRWISPRDKCIARDPKPYMTNEAVAAAIKDITPEALLRITEKARVYGVTVGSRNLWPAEMLPLLRSVCGRGLPGDAAIEAAWRLGGLAAVQVMTSTKTIKMLRAAS